MLMIGLLLRDKNKLQRGILQRFIDPLGDSNSKMYIISTSINDFGIGLIQSMWTNKICLLSKKTNIHRMNEKSLGIYERCVTFDGPLQYSESCNKIINSYIYLIYSPCKM